jgi:HPt (histidine-containing phosphotransfer) domain-containing protein
MEEKHMTTAPVIDEQVLALLEEELQDRQLLREFLRRYLNLLDHRLERLDLALTAGDPEAWMDAVLSLKSSSAMGGATALSQAAAQLQERIGLLHSAGHQWPQKDECARTSAGLHGLGQATRHQLGLYLVRIAS